MARLGYRNRSTVGQLKDKGMVSLSLLGSLTEENFVQFPDKLGRIAYDIRVMKIPS